MEFIFANITNINNIASWNMGRRILLILFITISSHLLVVFIKKISEFFTIKGKGKQRSKMISILSLFTSMAVFVIYFLAIGFVLKELGISLTAYIASASVIGFAVGFGSQGIVQDVVTGFTLIISNQIDVGDMVEINGQTGIVSSIGMRFVIFDNALGAKVYVPNRNINVVINYPQRHTNCQVDIFLPENPELKENVKDKVGKISKAVSEKYPNILVLAQPKSKVIKTTSDREVLRLAFQIWPERGAPIETTFRQELIVAIKTIDPSFADWMVSVNYEIEKEEVSSVQF